VAQARQTAEALLKRLLPERLPELQFVNSGEQPIPLDSYGMFTYSFRWQRMVGGIPFPGDGVTVEVSAGDGQVTGYHFDWRKADFPSAVGAISPEKARQAFDRAGMLELQYFFPSPVRPLAAGEEQKQRAQLVYRLYHPSGGLIDAVSGEPVVPPAGQWFGGGGAGGPMEAERQKMMSGSASAPVPLSPEEIKEIERTAKIISKEEALAAVKKWVAVPENLTLEQVSLSVDGRNPDERYWYLSWRAQQGETGGPQFMSASVNAATGELVSFDLPSPPAGPGQSGTLDRAAAQKMAAEFLSRVQPQRFREVKLDEYSSFSEPGPVQEGQNPPGQFFKYRRIVNGIPFPADGMSVRVDTVAGRITSYRLDWSNLTFPAPEGILGAPQAADAFLQARPLTLSFTQIYDPSGPGEVRLVYQPLAAPGVAASDLLDARTGEFLDWTGKPLSQQRRVYRFNDIAGNFAEEEISLLGQAGLFGEYGSAFHPEEKVTAVSLLRAMLMAKGEFFDGGVPADQDVLKRARVRGWLKEDLPPGGAVSRETLVKLMIRMLGLDRAAQVEGIYQVPYADASSFAPGSLGYVALAWGLGIVKGDGVNFAPGHEVTR
ncbi:MAG: YcdB/YcdC domain-containing protein, partial [Bacillota bacterium]